MKFSMKHISSSLFKRLSGTSFLFLTVVTVISLACGLPRIARYSAVDEHLWTYERIPQYWKAIKDQKWKKTSINDKPGVTVALVSGVGLLSINPTEYESVRVEPKGERELSIINAIDTSVRLPIYLFTLGMIPVFFLLLRRLLNREIALMSIALIYLSPILLGMSLYVNPDSLLWLFLPLSVISFLVFQKEKAWKYAVLSGIFLGLSLLTKYVATILYPFLLLLVYWESIFPGRGQGRNIDGVEDDSVETPPSAQGDLKRSWFGYFLVIAVSFAVIAILYPAVWVKPKVLAQTTFLSRPFENIYPYFFILVCVLAAEVFLFRSRISRFVLGCMRRWSRFLAISAVSLFFLALGFVFFNVFSGMSVVDFQSLLSVPKAGDDFLNIKNFIGGMLTGIYVIAFSIPPVVLLLFLLALFRSARRGRREGDTCGLSVSLALLVFTMLYYFASALSHIDATVRYQISVYPFVSIMAAIGAYHFFRMPSVARYISWKIGFVIIVVFSGASLFFIRPYFFAYASSLLPREYVINVKDMGDGSFEAAQYLNALPRAESLLIWTDKVAVCEHFVGHCFYNINQKMLDGKHFDYFVLSQGKKLKSTAFILSREIRNQDFARVIDLYDDNDFEGHLIALGGRESNFVKIVKNTFPSVSEKVTPLRKTPFPMPIIPELSFPDRECQLTEYGGIGDGETLNTESFRRAIADCAEKGGGHVVVPPGEWLTGAIHLEDFIDLRVEEGARIIFTDTLSEYLPAVFTRFEGTELYNYSPFIYANGRKNIAITGKGEIDGNAKMWNGWNKIQDSSIVELLQRARNGVPVIDRNFADPEHALQPSFVQFVRCDGILVEGVKITDSPSWTIHPIYSSNIVIRNIEVYTRAMNTDGVAVDSSRNVIIQDSIFHAGDDAVVIKSGRDRDGLRVGIPSENIVVHDIVVEEGHSGIAFGSEMSGGIRNVLAYNVNILNADYGFRFKSMRGRGGVVEDIFIRDSRAKSITYDAIQMDMNYGTPPDDYDRDQLPIFRSIELSNISVERSRTALYLVGLKESPLQNISFHNVSINAKKEGKIENVSKTSFDGVDIHILKK